jgi:Sulfotransferase family
VIEGFLGQVLTDQVLGWAFDREWPDLHLIVDLYCGDRHLGSTTADVYRPDLAVARIGAGDHAFSFRLARPLEPHELAAVVARAYRQTDPKASHELLRFSRADSASDRTAATVPADSYHDETQFPVFVLGAPRSGTSAVAQALMASTPYVGRSEGQILDLLAPLLHELRRFYGHKADELAHPERGSMIQEIPEGYFDMGIKALFADALRPLFRSSHWCDKTPTPDMIWGAPHMLRMWPNAKFIFMRRRGLENLLSRMRKFPTVSFEDQCQGWTACMEAWRAVRTELAGRALELDQYYIARHPDRAAQGISALLSLAPKETEALAQVLRRHQPQRTGANVLDICDAHTMGWDAAQWASFERLCGRTMEAYGYARDKSYFADDAEARSCMMI